MTAWALFCHDFDLSKGINILSEKCPVVLDHYISSATFYKWRSKYAGMDASLMARMRELETENARLKKMYAEERLKAEIIQEAMAKKW